LTDIPVASMEDMAKYVLVNDLGLEPVEFVQESGLKIHEGHLYFFDFGDLAVLILASEVLGRLIIFADLEALVSYDAPSSLLDRLAKILESSSELKNFKVTKIEIYSKDIEPIYLKLGSKYFRLNQEIDEERLEEIAKLVQFY
jgi:hypothetical protein